MVRKLVFEWLVTLFVPLWFHLKEVAGLHDPSELTLEDFRLELAELGLLGRSFGPEEYRVALEKRLGIEISVEELPDAEGGPLAGQLAAEGNLAEVVVDEESGHAVILARESLRDRPWPVYELGIFHELSHLAAGHPLRVKQALGTGKKSGRWFRRLASRLALQAPEGATNREDVEQPREEEVFEPEARKRAKWCVLAGTCPDAFEAERANRLT